MNLIIIFGLTVQCGCEVVSPLGTCSDPWWLTHCVYYCHSIHDNHILGWQGTTLGGSILWLLINVTKVITSPLLVGQFLKYGEELTLVCAWQKVTSHCEEGAWFGGELMLANCFFQVDL